MPALQSSPDGTLSPAVSGPIITPVTAAIGASVTELDVRSDASPEIQRRLVRALHKHGVLFVRFDGEIDAEDHKRFTRIFGELRGSPYNKGDISLLSVIDNDKLGKKNAQYFHSDHTVLAEPPGAAALRAITLPEVGGDTMWASMYAAYEALSSRMQHFLEGLEAVHSLEAVLSERPELRESNLIGEPQSATHPVVIRDPVTDKPALYVNRNFTERIVGLSEQESAGLLKMLLDHVNTPEFHVRLKWDTQTIAVWEESVTQHRAINDYAGRRVMNLVFTSGGVPTPYGDIIR